MTTTLPLSEQISTWALSMQLSCDVVEEAGIPFQRIVLTRDNEALMEIIPVPLACWAASGSLSLAEQLIRNLSTARASVRYAVVISEDYWIWKRPIVISRLSAMLGHSAKIPARLTKARKIERVEADNFLHINHLNGPTSSRSRYGLYLPKRYYRVLPADFAFDRSADELLVAVTTFSNARAFVQNGAPFRSYELIRFAGMLQTNVVGGLDKLIRAFVRERQPDDIMTYADTEWSDGRSYLRLGFEQRGEVAPREVRIDQSSGKRLSGNAMPAVDNLTVYNLGSVKFVLPFEYPSNAH